MRAVLTNLGVTSRMGVEHTASEKGAIVREQEWCRVNVLNVVGNTKSLL